MLEILNCARPEEKKILFDEVDADHSTWIVSDLQSKWQLQKELVQKRGVLEQTAVLRATELWQRLAFQVAPQLHPLSTELAQTLFWNWIKEMELPWARSPHAVPVVLNQMQMWMSIFSDPHFDEIMAEWFQENQEAYVRWGHWFELCSTIWRRCQEQNYVMTAWLPAVLLSSDLSRIRWKKTLTFDLGPQISQVEGQLIKELGRYIDVRVIYPEAPWLGLMQNTLRPYESLLSEFGEGTPPKGDPNWQPEVSRSISFGRFSTQLAEVKDAVAQVRSWLEAGVPAQSIALVAPDIEAYWPALRLYFQEEGIPVCKPTVAKLGGFVEIAQWLSSLRTVMSKVSSNDLEVFFFTQQKKPKLSFDEFKILFSHIYDAGDLNRAAQYFTGNEVPQSHSLLTVHDFLAWSLRFWDAEAEQKRLNSLVQVIGKEVPRQLQLTTLQWLSYLEGLLARRELSLEPAHENGVWAVSLTSSDWLPVTHGIFLNLNEGALRSIIQSPVSSAEGQRIFTDTGYAVGTTDRQELEFEFLWFLQKSWTELRLCFSATDFQGSVLTPSKLWMWAGFVSEQLKHQAEAPRLTRWDQLQALPLEDLGTRREFSADRTEALSLGLKRDVDASISTWGQSVPERLSASSLERYWTCPFIFASERELKLNDDPALDLDLDRRTRGVLLHAMVDKLGAEPFEPIWTDQELLDLIEKVRLEEEVQLGEERLWPAIRAQHLRLARQFLAFETEWRRRFPKTKTVARELGFEIPWPLETGQPTKMAGRLDRVDVDDQGRYAVVDYKASNNNTLNWNSWERNQSLQMPLYAMLLEEGKTSLPAGEVVAANYYVIKEMDRRKGFHLKDDTAELYENKGHRNFIGNEEKQKLYSTMKNMVDQAIVDMSLGHLNPAPKDTKTCTDCHWRSLCRAPHLN